jgi:catechol 2,3-dioxygenase-like lactoylglutathione lyase family enzyme
MTFAHLTLATQDVLATREFFERMLGWKAIQQPNNIDTDAAWLEIAPGQQVHLLRVAGFEASPFEQEYGRHLAMLRTRDDYESIQQRLKQAGVEIIPPLRPTPFDRFFFRDPNGYMLEIIDADAYVVE